MSKIYVISKTKAKKDNTVIQDSYSDKTTAACTSSAENVFAILSKLNADVSFVDIDDISMNRLMKIINDDDYVVIDSSLKKNAITNAFNKLKGIKAAYASSSYNARKLKSLLDKIDILKINKPQLNVLIKQTNSDEDVIELVKCLNDEGVKEVLVTDETILYLGIINDKVYRYIFYDYYEEIKNTTIVSDALLASYIFGKCNHLSINETVRFALSISVLAIDSDNKLAKVNVDMTLNLIKSRNN